MRRCKLGEICDIKSGGTPSRNRIEYWEGGSIPWVKIKDLKHKHISDTEEYITKAGLENSSAKIFPKGTVLLSIFATIGDSGILNIDAACNQAIAGIIPKYPEVDSEYLYYWMCSKKIDLKRRARGVAQTNINLSLLKELVVQVRSPYEQKQIVTSLSLLDKAINSETEFLTKCEDLVKSRFIEMFGNCKDEIQLRNCCSKITKGTTPTTMGFGFSNEGVNYIKVECLDDAGNYIDDKIAHVSIECHEKLKRSQLQEGDILFSIAGALGRTAIVPARLLPANTNQALAIIRLENEEVFDRAFLRYALASKTVEKILARQKRGVAQSNLSLNDVGKITIPHPPLSLQKEFAIFVQRSEKLRFDVQKQIDKLETLKAALMQKYFD